MWGSHSSRRNLQGTPYTDAGTSSHKCRVFRRTDTSWTDFEEGTWPSWFLVILGTDGWLSLTASNPRVLLSCPTFFKAYHCQDRMVLRLLRYLVYTGQVRAYRTLSYTLFSHIPPVMVHTYEPLSLFKLFVPHNFLPLTWTLSSDRRMICTRPLNIF